MYEERLRDTLPRVRDRIAAARERAGRSDVVDIVAVTKGHPAEAARAALCAGLRKLGENRVHELETKRAAVGPGAEWHLIGHLQRNKVRRALPLIHLLHSVDTQRLAAELSAEAERAGRAAEILVQVNASGEAAKSGFAVDGALSEIAEIARRPGLRVLGLMTMAPFVAEPEVLRETFRRTRALFDACAAAVPGFEARHLSMGMSNDYEIAVEEGSTMVRLGTTLFGERSP
jgi:pyridoxal phosphate enzyme (YggS family)